VGLDYPFKRSLKVLIQRCQTTVIQLLTIFSVIQLGETINLYLPVILKTGRIFCALCKHNSFFSWHGAFGYVCFVMSSFFTSMGYLVWLWMRLWWVVSWPGPFDDGMFCDESFLDLGNLVMGCFATGHFMTWVIWLWMFYDTFYDLGHLVMNILWWVVSWTGPFLVIGCLWWVFS
jgi:hypothetical protein